MTLIRERSIGELPEEFGFPSLRLLKRSIPGAPWWAKVESQVREFCGDQRVTLLGGGLVAQVQTAKGWINAKTVDVLTEMEYDDLLKKNLLSKSETLFCENVESIYFTTMQSDRAVVGILSYMYGDLSRAKVYASTSSGSTKIAHAISLIPAFSI